MITLNNPTATYATKSGKPHVYVSSHIIEHNGKVIRVEKPYYDYETGKPILRDVPFMNGIHHFQVHRYTKFSYFVKSMEKFSQGVVTLPFLTLDKWDDPYETILYRADNHNLGIQLACCCCTCERVEGEEASWKRNQTAYNDPVIRISFNYENLCDVLEQIGQKCNVKFYITIADYSNSIDQLKGLSKRSVTSVEEYINLLTLKRKAFAYENELRIFVVGRNLQLNGGLFVAESPKCDVKKLFDAVTMPPLPPYSRDNALYEHYSDVQFLNNLFIRKMLEKWLPSQKINQCRLYEINKSKAESHYKKGNTITL